jgi:hypothetical protein
VDPVEAHYLSENLVAPGIEPGISESVATEAVGSKLYESNKPTLS